ncbi:MAG: aspartate carbamoyltransferase [Planctomycetaceae bacterium]|nr:MAG: aspartate carbamoyltransferase [Planctomycetaceae bacterium]
MTEFKGLDILDGAQFSRDDIDCILQVADDFNHRLETEHSLDLLRGYVLGTLFFEPSTRTRLSFETAMHRLGGSVVGFSSAESTSTAKGETLSDTIRTVDQYVDLIAMRHPAIGSASLAASVAAAPVLNGGDGAGQHPTQALLDAYTIQRERGQLDGTTLVLCGDLKNGRTVHSGVEIYKHFNCRLVFVSPDTLRMPAEILDGLKTWGIDYGETTDLAAAIQDADVLYMTRIQKERFADPAEYERRQGTYLRSRELIERVNPRLTVMHPLPRVNEIAADVDELQGAAYFRQARNGVCVRMALMALVAGKV